MSWAQISTKKTETRTLYVNTGVSVKRDGAYLGQTDNFTTISTEAGTEEDIRNRLEKARNVFKSMNNVWRSSHQHQAEVIPQMCGIYIIMRPNAGG